MNEERYNLMDLLDLLQSNVEEAKAAPLSGRDKCVILRESTLNLIEDIRDRLPIELEDARNLLHSKNDFIANAKMEAEAIRQAGEEKARALVEEQEIVKAAKARANEVLELADNKAKELSASANQYVDEALRRAEDAVVAAAKEIHETRNKFRNAADTTNHELQEHRPQLHQ